MVKPDDKGADPKALKKELKSGQRDLDRESRRLEREEAKIITEIKAAAKKNDERTVRVLGKNLVQIRKQKDRLSTLKGNMKGMEYQATSMAAQSAMATALKSTTGVMAKMNLAMDPKDIQLTAQQMLRQKEQAGMTSEIMDDMFDAMDEDGIEAEMEAETAKVMEELQLETFSKLQGPASGTIAGGANARSVATSSGKLSAKEEKEAEELLRGLNIAA